MIRAPVNPHSHLHSSDRLHQHRAWVEVDFHALVENARAVAKASGAPLIPVIKADAYGLGAVGAAKALEVLEPWGYAVATVEEGVELRGAGIDRRLLVFAPVEPSRFAEFEWYQLTPVFDHLPALREWRLRGTRAFHVEIDTGMSRTGVRPEQLGEWREALDTPAFEGCFTQFHSAHRDVEATVAQWEKLTQAVGAMPHRPTVVHAANSAAALRGAAFAGDAVRPGIFMYGGDPGKGLPEGKPVARVLARVLSVRRIQAGDSVGYGATWHAPKATTIATLGIGYADGVRRSVVKSSDAHVLWKGARYPYAGVITMDLTMIDVGDARVERADIVTLLGADGGELISLAQLASWSAESQYVILTGLGPRLPRVPVP
ncbi:MAG TPA: alanine racemase [Gemmatimonadales bacterium]|nr:alanine racemase [Gemmatimonadales bacterium]